MTLLVTDAVVLHAFDYLETSRILRIATRSAGVQSVLARGARRSRARFGSALDLFATGIAEIRSQSGRDLQTLTSFEVTHARTGLGEELDRFTAASAVTEIVLRCAGDEFNEPLFEALLAVLDDLADVSAGDAVDVALAGAWRFVVQLGFAPTVDVCASCHAVLAESIAAPFSHPAGGSICARCARTVPTSRTLPADARSALRHWMAGERVALPGDPERRAHQRLLREFLREHLSDGRPMVAFDIWESARWTAAPGASGTKGPP